jgi:CTD small phosphatase-like protein 2
LEATAVLEDDRAYESDLVVVLDMDECLIHSKFLSDQAVKYAHQTRQERWVKRDLQPPSVDSFHIKLPDGDLVHVNQRPHLRSFIDHVTDRYETHIFTAAMEVYAKPVLDMLDPYGTKFSRRWYRDSCVQTKEGAYVKNLGVLQKNEARIVLVDNNPLSFLTHPRNGILVSSFYDDPQDKSLLAVLQLLEELEGHEDVRPLLDQRFGLKTALEDLTKGKVAGS